MHFRQRPSSAAPPPALQEHRPAFRRRLEQKLGGILAASVPGIVLRIHVGEPPRTNRVDLEDSFSLRPGKMMRAFRHDYEASSRHRLARLYVKLIPQPHVEGARDHCKMLICRMKCGGIL
jgi:hypothetical protein